MPKVVDHGSAAFGALPRCPTHLIAVARREWRRLASALHSVGVLTVADRAALAVYCQAYSRWVEAEEELRETQEEKRVLAYGILDQMTAVRS